MKYKVVRTINGRMTAETNLVDILAWAEIRGFKYAGLETGKHLREELRGHPKFEGLCGPMWDGDGVRYEDWVTYDMLSR